MRFVYFGLDFFAKWSELEEALEETSIFRLHMVKYKPVDGGGVGAIWIRSTTEKLFKLRECVNHVRPKK